MILNTFHTAYCLTLPHRTDRQFQVQKEFRQAGLSIPFFYALPGATNVQSFNLSSQAMLSNAIGTLITFEDDVQFVRPLNIAIDAIRQLPDDWDVVYLGANVTDPAPERYSRNLVRVRRAWTTHAVGYSESAREKILAGFDPMANQVYDDYLSSMLDQLKAYVVTPMVAYQRQCRADLFNPMANYFGIFKRSDRLLSNI